MLGRRSAFLRTAVPEPSVAQLTFESRGTAEADAAPCDGAAYPGGRDELWRGRVSDERFLDRRAARAAVAGQADADHAAADACHGQARWTARRAGAQRGVAVP